MSIVMIIGFRVIEQDRQDVLTSTISMTTQAFTRAIVLIRLIHVYQTACVSLKLRAQALMDRPSVTQLIVQDLTKNNFKRKQVPLAFTNEVYTFKIK